MLLRIGTLTIGLCFAFSSLQPGRADEPDSAGKELPREARDKLIRELLDLGARVKATKETLSIDLGRTRVTDGDLVILEKLARHLKPGALKVLEIDRTAITDKGLVHLEPLKRLKTLDLEFTAVTDEGLRRLGHLTSLTELDLEGTRVSGKGLKHLRAIKDLRLLDVRETSVTKEDVEELRRRLPDAEIRFGPNPARDRKPDQ